MRVSQILDAARDRLGMTRMVDGDATGADALARRYRDTHGIDGQSYPAEWRNLTHPDCVKRKNSLGHFYDANAGFRRNQEMLDKEQPAGVIAFRGGMGTLDMCKRAKRAGIRVVTIDWEMD